MEFGYGAGYRVFAVSQGVIVFWEWANYYLQVGLWLVQWYVYLVVAANIVHKEEEPCQLFGKDMLQIYRNT